MMSVEVEGMDELLRKLRGREFIDEPVQHLFRTAAIKGERLARMGAPHDTGALKRSIHSEAKPLSARVYSTKDYAVPVEMGRRAGARMPPPNAIAGWVRRHLGPDVSPFVVARAIARRGIRGRFFMQVTLDALARMLPSMVRDAARAIERGFGR